MEAMKVSIELSRASTKNADIAGGPPQVHQTTSLWNGDGLQMLVGRGRQQYRLRPHHRRSTAFLEAEAATPTGAQCGG